MKKVYTAFIPLLFLLITACKKDKTTTDVYDDIQFTDNNHFIAHIYTMNDTNKFYFKRWNFNH